MKLKNDDFILIIGLLSMLLDKFIDRVRWYYVVGNIFIWVNL